MLKLFNFLIKNNIKNFCKKNCLQLDLKNEQIDCFLYSNINLITQYIKKNELQYYKHSVKDFNFFIFNKNVNKIIILAPHIITDIKDISYDEFSYILNHMFDVDINIKSINIRKFTYDLYQYYNNQQNIPILKELMKNYKLVSFYKNRLILNQIIIPSKLIYSNDENIFKNIPMECKTIIYQLQFIFNCNNELVDVIVECNNKFHPNIDFKTNKYCIGNFRFNKLSVDLINHIIENIKIYNLINSYDVHPLLQKYIFQK